MIDNAFTTFRGMSTVNVAGTTVTANVQVSTIDNPQPGVRYQVRVLHTGGTLAFIAFGNSSVTVTTANGIPVVGFQPEVFTLPAGATHMAVIYGSGSGTVYATTGFGA